MSTGSERKGRWEACTGSEFDRERARVTRIVGETYEMQRWVPSPDDRDAEIERLRAGYERTSKTIREANVILGTPGADCLSNQAKRVIEQRDAALSRVKELEARLANVEKQRDHWRKESGTNQEYANRQHTEKLDAECDRDRWQSRANGADAFRDEWKARALAAEAKLTESEKAASLARMERDHMHASLIGANAKLTDAALVEAGWVPRDVAYKTSGFRHMDDFETVSAPLIAKWLSRRAAAKEGAE